MRLGDDDEVQKVDATYLGPPGKYIGRLRYRVVAIFMLVLPVALYLVGKTVGLGFFPVLWTVIGCMALSGWLADNISTDRPISTSIGVTARELVTPRREDRPESTRGPKLRAIPHLSVRHTITRPPGRKLY